MADSLSEDQIAEFKVTFDLFDLNGEGFIPSRDLATVMRSLGISLTEASLANLLADFDSENKGTISFADFLECMARKAIDASGGVDMVMESFKVFDKDNNGLVNVADLKHVMNKMGESMTNAEIEGILKEAEIDADGNFKYEDFVNHLNGTYELFQ